MFLVYLFSFGYGACRETLPFCYGWWLILRGLILLTLCWYKDVNILLTGLLLSNMFYVTLRNIVSECYYTRAYIARILYSQFFSLNIILTCYEGNIIGQKNTYITDTVRVRMILIDFAAKDRWNARYPCGA